MSKKLLPPRDMAWFDPQTGRPTDIFFDWAKSIDARVFREPVPITAPTKGQFMVYSEDVGSWTLQPVVAPADNEVLIYDTSTDTWIAGTN